MTQTAQSDNIKSGWPHTSREDLYYDPTVKWPSISIVIPSFNQGEYIEETILSILHQRYPTLQLIIIDGGSTDATLSIIHKYKDYISYWVSEKDRGQSHALNKGLAIATGEFFAWQNSDDIYYPGALKALALAATKGFDVVYSSISGIDGASQPVTQLYFVPFHPRLLKYYSIVFSNQAALYRTALIQKIQFDESLNYAMDFDLEFNLYKSGARFKYVPGIWGAIRFHSEAKTVAEFYNKVKKEEAVVRRRNGINVDDAQPLFKQFPVQYAWCLVYTFFYRFKYGGVLFRLKKLMVGQKQLYRTLASNSRII